jgi:hypothetical protein
MDYKLIIEQIEKRWNPPWTKFSIGFSVPEYTYSDNINGNNYYIELIRDNGLNKVKYISCTDIKNIRKEKLEKLNNINE